MLLSAPTMLASALAFLKRLKLSHIAMIAVVGLCLFLKLSLAAEQRHSAKVERQLVKAVAELRRISTAKDTQRKVTGETIVKAETGQREADKVAERIEAAPTELGCRTPSIILESNDL